MAERIVDYVDCQARALGQDGFQAIIHGPVAAGLLSASITIFAALMGYRLMSGDVPDRVEAVGKGARLMMVLALLTAWPAFQRLAYSVATDGPAQLASLLLPTIALSSEDLAQRVQRSYDIMRLGGATGTKTSPSESVDPISSTEQQPPAATVPPGFEARPFVASAFAISTVGVNGAFKIATSFLLATAPLALLGLLFDSTLGLFNGWVRALAGATLAVLGSTIVTAIALAVVENELSNLQAWSDGSRVDIVDPLALTTIVLCFVVVMLVTVLTAAKMAGAIELSGVNRNLLQRQREFSAEVVSRNPVAAAATVGAVPKPRELAEHRRAASVAEALASSVRRERLALSGSAQGRRQVDAVHSGADAIPVHDVPLGVSGIRTKVRRASSTMRRDRQ